MDKKYLLGFSLIFIFLFSCGGASANMVQHNFGGDFSMDVPKDSSFEKIESELYSELPFEEKDYMDEENNILVSYTSDAMLSEDNADCNYDILFKTVNPELEECIEYQDGNMKILEPEKKSDDSFSVVGMYEDNYTVILVGHDTDRLVSMMDSVNFSEV